MKNFNYIFCQKAVYFLRSSKKDDLDETEIEKLLNKREDAFKPFLTVPKKVTLIFLLLSNTVPSLQTFLNDKIARKLFFY